MKAGLQSFQHYLTLVPLKMIQARCHSVGEESDCPQGQPEHCCAGAKVLQASALEACLQGERGGSEEAPALAAAAGRMLLSRQHNALMWHGQSPFPPKPFPNNLCTAGCPSSMQGPTCCHCGHRISWLEWEGRRATQKFTGKAPKFTGTELGKLSR